MGREALAEEIQERRSVALQLRSLASGGDATNRIERHSAFRLWSQQRQNGANRAHAPANVEQTAAQRSAEERRRKKEAWGTEFDNSPGGEVVRNRFFPELTREKMNSSDANNYYNFDTALFRLLLKVSPNSIFGIMQIYAFFRRHLQDNSEEAVPFYLRAPERH